MNINKFVDLPKEDIFHTSDYAKVASSGSFGAASTETFERRNQINRNRRAVRGYGDSLIGRGDMREAARPQLDASSPLRSGMAAPSRQQYNTRSSGPVAVPPRTFTEPPGRGYNPYA